MYYKTILWNQGKILCLIQDNSIGKKTCRIFSLFFFTKNRIGGIPPCFLKIILKELFEAIFVNG